MSESHPTSSTYWHLIPGTANNHPNPWSTGPVLRRGRRARLSVHEGGPSDVGSLFCLQAPSSPAYYETPEAPRTLTGQPGDELLASARAGDGLRVKRLGDGHHG